MCVLNADIPHPVPSSSEDIHSSSDAARRALKLLAATRPDLSSAADAELWSERAATILAHNVASGRFASACRYERDAPPTLVGYAQRVSARLLDEWERVEALRTGDTLSWAATLRRLEQMAYFWLGPVGREEWASWEAREVAATTCADLWHWLQGNPFPFDVSFDRWAQRALNHRLHESVRSRRTYARYVVDSLDRPCFEDGLTHSDLPSTDDMRAWLELESNREVLRRAMGRLDRRQARILHLWYIEGWSAEEIAAETGLQVGYIYVLRYRGINKLRRYCVGE